MGTDIHIRVEARDAGAFDVDTGKFAEWSLVGDDGSPRWPYPEDDDGNTVWPDSDPTDRNYDVFAAIAGVRNGYGFAGVERHKPIRPAFEGRGIPDDHRLSPDDEPWLGDHSYTWATVAELRAVDWSQEFHATGVVSESEYGKWSGEGPPESWCGGVSGSTVTVHATPEDMVAARAREEAQHSGTGLVVRGRTETSHYCRISWTWQPLLRSGFYRWLHGDAVNALVERHGADNVRVIMGFDS